MTIDSNTKFMTIKELTGYLKISESTARRMTTDRIIPFYKVKGNIRLRTQDIIRYVESTRIESI